MAPVPLSTRGACIRGLIEDPRGWITLENPECQPPKVFVKRFDQMPTVGDRFEILEDFVECLVSGSTSTWLKGQMGSICGLKAREAASAADRALGPHLHNHVHMRWQNAGAFKCRFLQAVDSWT